MPVVHRLSFNCNTGYACSISLDMSCGQSLYEVLCMQKKMVRSSLSRPRRRLVLRWRDRPVIRQFAGQAWNRRRLLRLLPPFLREHADTFVPRGLLPHLIPPYQRPRHYVRAFRPMEADPWIAASQYVPGAMWKTTASARRSTTPTTKPATLPKRRPTTSSRLTQSLGE